MTEQELINLLKNDAEKGLQKLMDLYGRAFKVICGNILRDCSKEDIEEAVSDGLVAIWNSIGRYHKIEEISFKSYCYGIVRKCALKKRRECLKTGELIPLSEDLLDNGQSVESLLEIKEERRILEAVLEESKEPVRTIFILRYFYFFKIKEIAGLLKLSSKQVENYLYRGKNVLKKALMERGIR